ncbi:hypothetical protein [Neobacillus citreus]|uniref:Uncharacterized protein n=1 Tax=Neobacillus citreus TaxID=2833578 RepID=A0A942T464_9BACI|nr:hypothetical protein [Neobacillus citreus]MCH6265343.1 hypothetical protein [Neobacillus citreus]
MENKILALLEKMNDRQERMEEKLERIDDRQHNMEDKLDQVFETVKRIEVSQKDDVIGLLKLQRKNLDS